jgi:putative oxidoreductase
MSLVLQKEVIMNESKWHDITHFGVRAALGAIFIVHSLKKFEPGWQDWLVNSAGLPPEMQFPIALAELIGGILLIAGVLTRITGVVFSVILLGAIFHIRWENGFFVSQGGWEWDLIMLATSLLIIAAGPGRISISRLVRKIPSYLQ